MLYITWEHGNKKTDTNPSGSFRKFTDKKLPAFTDK